MVITLQYIKYIFITYIKTYFTLLNYTVLHVNYISIKLGGREINISKYLQDKIKIHVQFFFFNFLSHELNFHRIKRIDAGLQDEKWNGNSGTQIQHEVCCSHIPNGRLIMCNPGEGIVLFITPVSPNTQRLLLFAISK